MNPLEGGLGKSHGQIPWGAFLDQAPADWQLLQQDERGQARIALAGHWVLKEGARNEALGPGGVAGEVQIRLVNELDGSPLEGFAWTPAETMADGRWEKNLEAVPAGGPYRLETRLSPKGNKLGEWSLRGDMRHFLGVGDIWIVAGQSNASGYGRAPMEDGPELGIHLFRQAGRWMLASHPISDSTGSAFDANRETYNGGHSPFLHFARLLKRELGFPIALIPAALGGSPLKAWGSGKGPLTENMLAMARAAGGKVKGMVWCQGESDAEAGFAEDYLERFLSAAESWRRALGQRDLPIVTVQLGRYRSRKAGEEDEEWSLVREAQRKAVAMSEGLTVVPSLDIPLDDTIHFSSAGNMVLGGRLAASALSLAYGRSPEARAPQLLAAKHSGDRVVELKFGPITSRLDTHHPKARPFRVEDTEGEIPVEDLVFYRKDTARLFLARRLRGPAFVSCGYGEDPDTLPIDIERHMPILACHRFPVEPG